MQLTIIYPCDKHLLDLSIEIYSSLICSACSHSLKFSSFTLEFLHSTLTNWMFQLYLLCSLIFFWAISSLNSYVWPRVMVIAYLFCQVNEIGLEQVYLMIDFESLSYNFWCRYVQILTTISSSFCWEELEAVMIKTDLWMLMNDLW